MPSFKSLLCALLCIFSGFSFADPATVKINWSNPDNYKDIEATAGESEEAFRQRLASNIQAHMDELAADLPENSVLEMTFTDVTLAGSVRVSGANAGYKDVRVMKDGYRARMSFDYNFLDANGQQVKQGEENLQSPLSSTRISRTAKNQPFEIEKKMLTSWFRKTLSK